MKPRLWIAIFLAAGNLWAQPLRLEVGKVSKTQPQADGTIGQEEYSGRTVDKNTGVEIWSAADSANIYIALRSPGSGWLAMGFGSSGMKGALMVLAHKNEKGTWTVEQHLGKAFFRHSQVERPNLISGMAWQEKGLTCMEFSLPLDYAPGKSMRSKDPTPIILAYHKDRGDLSKHSRRSSGTIALAK